MRATLLVKEAPTGLLRFPMPRLDDAHSPVGSGVVTKEQVQQAARQILRPDAMVWLVIGDRSKVDTQLKKAGIAYKVLTPEP